MTVVVPVALIVKVQRTRVFHHRLKKGPVWTRGFWFLLGGFICLRFRDRCFPRVVPSKRGYYLLRIGSKQARIVEIEIWSQNSKDFLGLLQSRF